MSDKNKNKNFTPKVPQKPNFQLWLIVAAVAVLLGLTWVQQRGVVLDITQKRFEDIYTAGDVSKVVIVRNMNRVDVTLKAAALQKAKYKTELEANSTFFNPEGPHYSLQVTTADKFQADFQALEEKMPAGSEKIGFSVTNEENWSNYFGSFGFMILIFVLFWFMIRRMSGGAGPGGQIFNVGKSKAQLFDADNKVKITFDNVAGLDEAKVEIQEIVEFLKNPSKFTKLGGKIPKGALLVGPPGTGKTLLAKAVAGEAGVPFFTLSGSDFVEMFVGVGAARVRDLFKQAKEKAPCIIFIDEIDAIGRSRGKGQMPGSNDERENTLNSLLVEMDGFGTDSGVIVLAATNRPDVLDSALLRAGRFDRQISIDKPDIVGREAIFKVHLKHIKTNTEVDPKKLAAQTPGFAGAEIANVCNEAALIAARKNKEAVDMQDFQDAIDRVIGGLEKKTKIISPEEKKIVAYHEAGHAVAGWFLEHADPLVKVSIVPRGIAALGYAQYLPKEQFLYQTEQLIDEMCMTLGGRAAEQIIFGKISTGALSDLERITKMAYSMVSVYGMNEKLGNVSFYDSKSDGYKMTKPFSEATAEIIDQEVSKLIQHAYTRVLDLLRKHQAELEILAKELLEKEILFQADLERLIGKRPFEKETTYQAFTNKKESVLVEPTPEVAEGAEKEEAAEALPPTPDAAAEETKTEA